jgi:hypothetical protein
MEVLMDARSAWTPRNIYLYLVCLITLVITIFALTNAVRSTVELAYPEPALVAVSPLPEGTPNGDTGQQEEQADFLRRSSQRRAILSLVGNGALLAVTVPLYLYHWRAIGRERAGSAP